MIMGCFLLRKLGSGQYFDQFLSSTDNLYKWQCLLPQNPSQYLQKQKIFDKTFTEGCVPTIWKAANISALYKNKGD